MKKRKWILYLGLLVFNFIFSCGTKTNQEALEGLYYSSCNDYDINQEKIHFGLYPRPFFYFFPQSDRVSVFFSDGTERQTKYFWANDSLIKIEQYGEWRFNPKNKTLLWNNPFEENTQSNCDYIAFAFPADFPIENIKKQALEFFQTKAREIISEHVYHYQDHTLYLDKTGRVQKENSELLYYWIDQNQQFLDFDLIYFLSSDTEMPREPSMAFILTQDKLQFYELEDLKPPSLGPLIIEYHIETEEEQDALYSD